MLPKPVSSVLFVSIIALPAVLFSRGAVAECSYEDAALYNGWGWNPVDSVSCPPPDMCDYTEAHLNGGWGWNPVTRLSCPPTAVVAGDCIDPDGDGWGWNGLNSCLINETSAVDDHLVFVDLPGNATAYEYTLSPDGSSSVFYYWGDDLYSGDDSAADVFALENNTGELRLLTVGEGGAKANNDSYLNDISDDGRLVLIHSRVTNFAGTTANGIEQPYLIEVASGKITQLLPRSPLSNVRSVLSGDGKFVAFSTSSGNVLGADNNDRSDVFLLNVLDREIIRVSQSDAGEGLPGFAEIRDISRDGRFVLYMYEANIQSAGSPWLTGLYLYDRVEQTSRAVRYLDAGFYAASMSGDGRVVAHQYGDQNGTSIAWIDTQTGSVRSLDTSGIGYSSGPRVSPDGKFAAFTSSKRNLVDDIAVSGERQQLYLTELNTGKTMMISRSPDGLEANGYVGSPDFVGGGRFVRFTSTASNLHSMDTDTNDDVYLFEVPIQE